MKLKYFMQHGWDREWVETVEEIVWDKFAKYNIHDELVANICV